MTFQSSVVFAAIRHCLTSPAHRPHGWLGMAPSCVREKVLKEVETFLPMKILMFNADICRNPVCFQLVCPSLNISLLISETDPLYSELVYKSLYWVTYSFLGKIKFFKRSLLQRHFFEVVFTHASFSQGKTKTSTDVFSPLGPRISKNPIFVPCCAFSLKLASLACPH